MVWLRNKLMPEIKENVQLAQYTTFRIGGPARYFVEVADEAGVREAIAWARNRKVGFFCLGGGSNLLVSDRGYDGLVIRMNLSRIDFLADNRSVSVGSGTPLSAVVRESVERGLSGLEWAIGIPGTVGGAVFGNAGAYGGSMQNIVGEVVAIDLERPEPGTVVLENGDCRFGYRSSIFKESKKYFILAVKINLAESDRLSVKELVSHNLTARIGKQPKGNPSAGSFFMNPVVEDERVRLEFEQDKGVKCRDKKVPAGWLIEQAGLKGKQIGGAQVSEISANYVINTGGATADDVLALVSFIKQQVRDKIGVQLREEVGYLGF